MPSNRLRLQNFVSTQRAPAASRASWIGTLKVDDLIVPIKAYSAIASPETHLHQVHAGCGRRVSYQKVCSAHGNLEADQIQKAFAYSPDSLIELSDDEIEQLSPVDDKTIALERFFSPNQLDLTLLAGRSLFLTPANLAAQHPFGVLRAALNQKRKWALGRTVFSQKRQLVVVHSGDETLVLHTLHDPVIRRASIPVQANGSSPSRTEIRKLANMMDKCSDQFEWMDFRDDSHERLAALVARKVEAQNVGRNGKAKTTNMSTSRRKPRSRTAAKAA